MHIQTHILIATTTPLHTHVTPQNSYHCMMIVLALFSSLAGVAPAQNWGVMELQKRTRW